MGLKPKREVESMTTETGQRNPPLPAGVFSVFGYEISSHGTEDDIFENGFRWVEIDPDQFQDLCDSLDPEKDKK